MITYLAVVWNFGEPQWASVSPVIFSCGSPCWTHGGYIQVTGKPHKQLPPAPPPQSLEESISEAPSDDPCSDFSLPNPCCSFSILLVTVTPWEFGRPATTRISNNCIISSMWRSSRTHRDNPIKKCKRILSSTKNGPYPYQLYHMHHNFCHCVPWDTQWF